MRTSGGQRRGLMLAMVVVVMSVVAGFVSILAVYSTRFYQDRQAVRVGIVARAIADSAAVYARAQLPRWVQAPPAGPIQLEVGDLLPPRMTGSASISLVDVGGRQVCRVSTRAEWGPYAVVDEIDLPIKK